MNNDHHLLNAHAQAMMEISAHYLLNPEHPDSVQRYRQLWHTAQQQGDRQSLRTLRQHVTTAGRALQQRRHTRQNHLLWLDLLSLRCYMVIPRMRF